LSPRVGQTISKERSDRPSLVSLAGHPSRRATASPAAVLRGEVRLIAATTTRLHPPTPSELGRVNAEQWRELRQRLEHRRHARTLRTRFRRNPDDYLAELEQKACQPTLPA